MPETPDANACSQTAQENADIEVAVLARVYGLILMWSQRIDADTAQGIKESGILPETDSEEPEAGEAKSSTLKTE